MAIEDAIEQMPLSEPARRELHRLVAASEDRLPDHSIFREPGYLRTISYRDFLTKHLGIEQPEVMALLQDMPSFYWGHGIDVVPALDALAFGLPGLGSTSLGSFEGLIRRAISFALEPYLYHFPDGNASVARLLVRRLIPGVTGGTSVEDLVTAAFDYSALDRADSDVRLRLGSTVVRVEHDGDPRRAERVDRGHDVDPVPVVGARRVLEQRDYLRLLDAEVLREEVPVRDRLEVARLAEDGVVREPIF